MDVVLVLKKRNIFNEWHMQKWLKQLISSSVAIVHLLHRLLEASPQKMQDWQFYEVRKSAFPLFQENDGNHRSSG